MTPVTYKQLIQSEPRPLIFGFVHSLFSGWGQTFMIALFIPALKPVFGLSNTEFGSLYSLATLLSATTLPFFGTLLDRMTLRSFSLMTTLMMVAACWTLASASSLWILTLGLMLQRLSGQGLMAQTASVSVARHFGQARGKALSLATLGFPLSEALFPPLITLIIADLGWRQGFLFISLSLLILLLPIAQFLIGAKETFNHPTHRQYQGQSQSSEERQWTRSEVVKNSYFYFQLPQSLMPAFLLTGLFFHQGSLAQAKGWGLTWMASSFAAFAASRSLMSFIIGPAVDRFGAHRIFPFSLLPLVAAVLCLAQGESPWTSMLYLGLAGITVGASNPIKSALWAEAYGAKHLGAIRSLFSTLAIFSTSLSPILFGWFLDRKLSLDILLYGAASLMLLTSTLSTLARLPEWRAR